MTSGEPCGNAETAPLVDFDYTRRGVRRRELPRHGSGMCADCRVRFDSPAAAQEACAHTRSSGHRTYITLTADLSFERLADGIA